MVILVNVNGSCYFYLLFSDINCGVHYMLAKWHKYSYSAQLEERHSILIFLIALIVLIIVFCITNRYLVTMFDVRSETMEPVITNGDRVITTPLYNSKSKDNTSFSLLIMPKRGDLVVVAPAYVSEDNKLITIINSIVSFFTLQKCKLFGQDTTWGEKPVIRRLVGLPGDSLYMENFVLHIKPANSAYYLTEFEITERDYDIRLDKLPENWNTMLPFSSSFPTITLGPDEFFVLCDNRKQASDSRIWGTIPANRLQGKVLFRYWPLNHFGIP